MKIFLKIVYKVVILNISNILLVLLKKTEKKS